MRKNGLDISPTMIRENNMNIKNRNYDNKNNLTEKESSAVIGALSGEVNDLNTGNSVYSWAITQSHNNLKTINNDGGHFCDTGGIPVCRDNGNWCTPSTLPMCTE